MRAFYFSNSDKKLRHNDGRQIRKGRTHKVKCDPVLCEWGLHASERLIDALKYAPGKYLWLVDLNGKIVAGDDKAVADERKYIDGFDAGDLLHEFSRKAALINIKKIYKYCSQKDYDLIVEYLETGNDDIRSAARSAANAAVNAAASAAASAEWSVEWSAARSVEWSAVASAANAAASAANAAASAASAEWSAAASARSAAASARSAEWSNLNKLLTDMVRAKTGWDI